MPVSSSSHLLVTERRQSALVPDHGPSLARVSVSAELTRWGGREFHGAPARLGSWLPGQAVSETRVVGRQDLPPHSRGTFYYFIVAAEWAAPPDDSLPPVWGCTRMEGPVLWFI